MSKTSDYFVAWHKVGKSFISFVVGYRCRIPILFAQNLNIYEYYTLNVDLVGDLYSWPKH